MARTFVATLVTAIASAAPATAQCELTKLQATDAIGGEKFGLDIDLSGTFAIMGAPFDSEASSIAGAAYVFERGPGGWTEVTKFIASDAEELDRNGWRVGIDGETAIVGSRYTEDNGYGTGSAYILERQVGGSWLETAKLLADDLEPFSFFANDVDVSDNGIAVVGAPSDDDLGGLAGAIYVFEESGGIWDQVAKVYGSTTTTEDRVGYSVALSGTTFVAGAFQHDGIGPDSGVAYVFEKLSGVWVQTAELIPSDTSAGAAFGIDVAISGNSIAVGAHLESSEVTNGGAVYLFRRQGPNWVEVGKLTADSPQTNAFFGESIDISDTDILVGAFGAAEAGPGSGAAYHFPVDGFTIGAPRLLVPSDLVPGDALGTAVAIESSGTILVASRDDSPALDAGAVYEFGSTEEQLALTSTTSTISLATGGTQLMQLATCPPRPGNIFFVLGTVSGTEPGFDIGNLHLPLNPDFYLVLSLTNPNGYPLPQSTGLLDASGFGSAAFSIDSSENQGLAGTVIHHSFGLIDTVGQLVPLASTPLPLTLVP